MRSNLRRKLMAFWKQDAIALFAVILYLAFALCVTEVWNTLSNQADAFANTAAYVGGK
ncbi:MAG: hypothetical protein WA712_19275 [Pseudolabrys sp.]